MSVTLIQERGIEEGKEKGGEGKIEEKKKKKIATNLSKDYVISKSREILRGIRDSRRKSFKVPVTSDRDAF